MASEAVRRPRRLCPNRLSMARWMPGMQSLEDRGSKADAHHLRPIIMHRARNPAGLPVLIGFAAWSYPSTRCGPKKTGDPERSSCVARCPRQLDWPQADMAGVANPLCQEPSGGSVTEMSVAVSGLPKAPAARTLLALGRVGIRSLGPVGSGAASAPVNGREFAHGRYRAESIVVEGPGATWVSLFSRRSA